uniref:Pentatricopeptide repeat-containing protein At1g26900, mitochondrial n=1 Tax=Anthurium amnicola TaxID=1678845 RepID=A0A1D1Y4I1_9ARAE
MLRAHSLASSNPAMGEVLSLFNSIRARGLRPDRFSFVAALKSCSRAAALHPGRTIHGCLLRSGFELSLNPSNTLIAFYCACGVIGHAEQLFDEMCQRRDAVSFSALMGGYLRDSRREEVVELYREMRRGGFVMTPSVIVCALTSSGCDSISISVGELLHGYCIKTGFSLELNVATSTMMMYGKHGRMVSARCVFEAMPLRDVVMWNCIIDGYAKCGLIEESLALLQQMRAEGLKVNAATLAGLLSACASSGAFLVGRHTHRYIEEEGLELDAILGTALIDMYSKCGYMDMAAHIFDRIPVRDVKSWTAMIMGFGINGNAKAAVELFREMEEMGMRPNEVTFLAVLNACSHAGLVVSGKEYLEKMVIGYDFSPRIEHYGCVVDLLGRAGLLEEAYELIMSLPIQRDSTAWRALLSACRVYGNIEIGEIAQQSLVALGDQHPTDSILLSNTYAMAGKQVDTLLVTDLQVVKMKKEAGCSSIETNN